MNDILNLKSNDKVLEIGYGPGTGLKYIIEKNSSSQYVGTDFSELMHQKASKTNKKFIQEGKVELLFGDFLFNKDLATNFDKVFCINVVYFWDDLIIPFEKVYSLINSGGAFYIFMAKNTDLAKLKFTVDEIFNKSSIEQVVEALKLAGFNNVDYSFDKGYYITAQKF